MQQQFLFKLPKQEREFGGSLLKKGRRKQGRPLNFAEPIHLVLRANVTDAESLLQLQGWVELYLQKFSECFGVRIYRKATVGNHIHLLIRVANRESYRSFVRAFCGAMAKSRKVKWECRPYSRIVKWGRDFEYVKKYVQQNEFEAFGLVEYRSRIRRMRETALTSLSN